MRWLIVGPYPPEQGSGAAAAAAVVAERLAAGDTVHAVSPRPSAAHTHRPLSGLRAMRDLAVLARRERASGLWVRIEPGILLRPGTARLQTLVERAALALLLRRFERRVVDVGDVGLLPGGRAGRPVFAAATQLVAHDEATEATLIANGAPSSKVVRLEADQPPAMSATTPEPTGPVAYPEPAVLRDLAPSRLAIEAAVQARAVELQAARTAARARSRTEG